MSKIQKNKEINKVDTKLKSHKCEVCGQGCVSKSALIVHMRIHTGSKPFKCELCENSFAQKSTLSTHIQTKDWNYTNVKFVAKDSWEKAL